MALREFYSNFKFYQMFEDSEKSVTQIPASGELSSYSIDTQGYEAALIVVHTGSCDVADSGSCMQLRLMHASHSTSGIDAYANVSSTDVVASDISSGSALTSGIIIDWDISTTSQLSRQSQIFLFGYKGGKRYLKLMLESTGSVNTGSICMGAICILGYPANWPVNTYGS